MLRIKLIDHNFRYEVFQIVSLFYNKSEIQFYNDSDISDINEVSESSIFSGFDAKNSKIYCKVVGLNEKPIFYEMKTDINIKKQFKNAIKLTLLHCLKELTGKEIPWGILVGIRPTKIVHEAIKEGLDKEKVYRRLTEDYNVSENKAKLTMEVAENESKFLTNMKKDISLYVGIPFCPTRCSYCSFTSNALKGNGDLVEAYIVNLIHEIDEMLKFINKNEYNIDTVYFGGGTPTSISALQLDRILNTLSKYLSLRDLREFTIEAGRADSIDRDKLKVIKASGCNRISINPQTMNDETLIRVGRMHSSRDVVEKYNMARELGFDNINMDLIIGLPGEGEKEIRKTINELHKLSPENVTVHTMAIKRASVLNEMEYSKRNSEAKGMYDIATSSLRNMGMYPYYMYRQKNMVSPLENIGYCKAGKECIYNIQMIAENISIIALGADGVTKIVYKEENRIERSANLKDVREYNKRIEEMIDNKKRLFESR
jgi:coproporphyrinogen dehydrogenase HemZ